MTSSSLWWWRKSRWNLLPSPQEYTKLLFLHRNDNDVIMCCMYVLQPPVPPPRKTPESDFDLDSLLSDLSSFDPSDVVAATHPSTSSTPPITPAHTHTPEQPSPHPSPAHYPQPRTTSSTPPSHTTPVHNHTAPTPPHTPGHGPLVARSYTEVDRDRPRRTSEHEGFHRSYSESRPSPNEGTGMHSAPSVYTVTGV